MAFISNSKFQNLKDKTKAQYPYKIFLILDQRKMFLLAESDSFEQSVESKLHDLQTYTYDATTCNTYSHDSVGKVSPRITPA